MYNWMNPAIQKALLATLLHSIWQAALVALILFLLFRFLKQRSSQFRYLLAVTGLSMVFIMAIATFLITWSPEIAKPIHQITALSAKTSVNNPSTVTQTNSSLAWNQKLLANAHYLIYAWYLGVLIMSIRFMGGYLMIIRLRFVGLQTLSASWINRIQEIKQAMNLNSDLRIYESTQVAVPLTFGFFKPLILLPLGMVNGMNTEELETILVHELYHIQRHDFLVNIFQALVEVLLFYHPAVWWISAKIREEREYCCDDATIAFTQQPISYAKALTHLQSNQVFTKPNFVMAATQNQGQLTKRVYRLFNQNTIHERGRAAILFLLMITVSAFSWVKQTEYETELNQTEQVSVSFTATFVEAITMKNEHTKLKLNPPVSIAINNFEQDPTTLILFNGKPLETMDQLDAIDQQAIYFVYKVKPDQAQLKWGKQYTNGAIIIECESAEGHSKQTDKSSDLELEATTIEDLTMVIRSPNKPAEIYMTKSAANQSEKMNQTIEDAAPIIEDETAFIWNNDEVTTARQDAASDTSKYIKVSRNHAQVLDPITITQKASGKIEPLFVLNDLLITKEAMEKLDPNQIQEIQIVKGEAALKMFGNEGKDGVILIYTKKYKKKLLKQELNKEMGMNLDIPQIAEPVVYPNPSKGVFSIDWEITKQSSEVSLTLINEKGERRATVAPKVYEKGNHTFVLDASQTVWPAGIYFLEIQIDQEKHRKRVVVE